MAYYTNDHTSFMRLRDEFVKHGKLIIAVDFDDTVYNHNSGYPNQDICNLLQRWKPYAEIIIWSCRQPDEYAFIMDICKQGGFIPDHINEDSDLKTFDTRKLYYNVLLDDRAGLQQVYNDLYELINLIEEERIEKYVKI